MTCAPGPGVGGIVLLQDLFAGVDAEVPAGAAGVDVRALAVDSRRVGPGALFAALAGVNADGTDFAVQAVEHGAAAVLAARPLRLKAPVVVASDPRRAFSLAAARFHGEPSRRLSLFGVTGTNGKTTTAYLIEQISAARGVATGLIGTVESRWPGGRMPATHTTPESHELQELLRRMADAGSQVVAMEVSSHALSQERAAGCVFSGAAFAKLTRDKLDYHCSRDVVRVIPECPGAPGRLERVPDPEGRVVLVDYAHTDDALARVLDALRQAAAPRIVCVFGCGGDRDRGKRPLMGEAAGGRADLVVATSDNPRTEDPLAILAAIEPGLARSGKAKLDPRHARMGLDGYCVVPDRREAIALALRCARPGDAVLLAGKGHEDYQIVGKEKRPFDDRLEARRALEEISR